MPVVGVIGAVKFRALGEVPIVRTLLLFAVLLACLGAGCRPIGPRYNPGTPRGDPGAAIDWREKGSICQALIVFQGAFIRHDAKECLEVLTPELQQRYKAAFHSGRIFGVSGKEAQDILQWSDSVRVDSTELPHARAYYCIGQRPAEAQTGVLLVGLIKSGGLWKISALDLGLGPDVPIPPKQSRRR